jgi:hypothetical protein
MDEWYDKYNTQIPAEAVPSFLQWAEMMSAKTGRNVLEDKSSYDIQGYFLSGEWKKFGDDPSGHMPDTYKKPNHITFSKDSKYSGIDGYEGGEWVKKGEKWNYSPSQSVIDLQGLPNLVNYFNQYEPDSELILK